MAKGLKREPESREDDGVGGERKAERSASGESRQGVADRRILRSQYMAVKNLISDRRDDLSRADSDKFHSIIDEVENLHRQVQKPREQVADAEALLDIANTLVMSVKSQSNEGVTPSDFITSLIRNFGQQDGGMSGENVDNIAWSNVGLAISHVFKKVQGCCTMLGPMDTELKQRKTVVQRKRARPTATTRPEELGDTRANKKSDTDKNMSVMFEILRKNRNARLENLVLCRDSFAQTVENIFALSFLVKDGRAEIKMDDNGQHLVSPRNAPQASAITSGDVSYNHFVFRFDFKDWKLMMNAVGVGEEIMPHRSGLGINSLPKVDIMTSNSQSAAPTTPIKKLSRNHGLIIQEQSVVQDSPENDSSERKIYPKQE